MENAQLEMSELLLYLFGLFELVTFLCLLSIFDAPHPVCQERMFYSVLRPFQDYFSLYEMGQSVGGAKTGEPREKHLAHPQAALGLSHMWPVWAVLEPTPDTAVR